MTRIVEHARSGPYMVKKADIAGESVAICACGLSADKPFCDGSHKATRDETPGKLYRYPNDDDANGRHEVDPAALEPAADAAVASKRSVAE